MQMPMSIEASTLHWQPLQASTSSHFQSWCPSAWLEPYLWMEHPWSANPGWATGGTALCAGTANFGCWERPPGQWQQCIDIDGAAMTNKQDTDDHKTLAGFTDNQRQDISTSHFSKLGSVVGDEQGCRGEHCSDELVGDIMKQVAEFLQECGTPQEYDKSDIHAGSFLQKRQTPQSASCMHGVQELQSEPSVGGGGDRADGGARGDGGSGRGREDGPREATAASGEGNETIQKKKAAAYAGVEAGAGARKAEVEGGGRGGRGEEGEGEEEASWEKVGKTHIDGEEYAEDIVLSAVKSLYDDGIDPEAVLLKRRILEQSGQKWTEDTIRHVCRSHGMLVEDLPQKSGSRFVVRLQGVDFVNAMTDDLGLPQHAWDKLQSYFSAGDVFLKRCRATSNYELARHLQEIKVAELHCYRLGEVCCVVRACLEKRWLGHQRVDGKSILVPFSQSDEFKKMNSVPANCNSYVSTWADLKSKLREILEDDVKDQGYRLSTFKKRFVRRFDVELIEAHFGYYKLASLLADERLAGVCEVRHDGTTAWVVQPCSGNPANPD